LKLKEGVNLKRVVICQHGDDLVVGSSTGRLLRLEVNDENLPVMGRNAQGGLIMRLLPGEEVSDAAISKTKESIIAYSTERSVFRIDTDTIRQVTRGSVGTLALRFNSDKEQLKGLLAFKSGTLAILMSNGTNLRCKTDEDTFREQMIKEAAKEEIISEGFITQVES